MGSANGSIGKMRSFAIIFLSAAAVVRANPCQNNEDVYFPDPEDCGRFYMCVDGEVVGHMSCPEGLLLLPLQGGCQEVLRGSGVLPEHGRQACGDQLGGGERDCGR